MFCRHCANSVAPGAVACPNCGLPPLKDNKFCNHCAAPTHPEAVACPNCGKSLKSVAASTMPVSAKALGITSAVLGALAFGIQMVGTLICGWIGWPLGIAAIICGIIAFVQGEKVLGIVGCVLSILGPLLQVIGLSAVTNSLLHSVPPPQSGPYHHP